LNGAHDIERERIFSGQRGFFVKNHDDRVTVLLDRAVGAVAIVAFFLLMLEQTDAIDSYRSIFQKINIVILFVFLLDVLARIALARNRFRHIRRKWFDFIVLIPLVQFIRGIENYSFFVIVRQVVVIVMLISRTRKTQRFIANLALKPVQLMVLSFIFAICAGTVLLMLPLATTSGLRMSLIDSLFTATSATCVTGLIVKDTATYFSRFGQLVILTLIQAGGLGIMTFSVFLVLLGRKRMDLRHRAVMEEVMDQQTLTNATGLIGFIFLMTFLFELGGAIGLSFAWRGRFDSEFLLWYHAAFHSVSAFCNAGFSTFSDSLVGFSHDIPTNIIICMLIVMGGLGFVAVRDLHEIFQARILRRRGEKPRIRIQTRMVILVSVLLILGGALGFYFFERGNTLQGEKPIACMLLSLFQSITTRTAGFNTCDIEKLTPAALFLMIILMFIGASPGSTGGGLKTTTTAVLWASMVNGFSQTRQVEVFRRTIPAETIQKALTVFLFYIAIILVFILSLLMVERLTMTATMFEAVSAIGTVGLSTGVTPEITRPGKMLVVALMFIGRLGPLSIGYALLRHRRRSNYSYAEERVMIG
jgi:trk system potassium uptake protein TrkH